ncbi:DUF1758 domain-containing protein [Trichonephila clavipes]|nr:DUF1758 domain-containing protein [Trichonephila clavipes]
MSFVRGVKSFLTCPCSLLASPAHLLDYWGISQRQLYEEQDLVCDTITRKAIEIVETMFGENFVKELQSIPLSNDTVCRRIDDIAEDVELQLFGKLLDKLFSIQLDETTDSNKDAHFIAKKKNVKSWITKWQNKTEEEIEKLNNVGLLARKNKFLEFRNEIKDILDSIISICEEKDEETYCTEKDGILDTLEEILVAIDTQLMPSVVNSDFEVKNQGSSQDLVSARSAEVKLPTLSLPIFSGVTEEWLAFSDLFEAAVSDNKDLTGAQKLQYLKGSLKSDALKIVKSLSVTNE